MIYNIIFPVGGLGIMEYMFMGIALYSFVDWFFWRDVKPSTFLDRIF